jgi:hypothetical protein
MPRHEASTRPQLNLSRPFRDDSLGRPPTSSHFVFCLVVLLTVTRRKHAYLTLSRLISPAPNPLATMAPFPILSPLGLPKLDEEEEHASRSHLRDVMCASTHVPCSSNTPSLFEGRVASGTPAFGSVAAARLWSVSDMIEFSRADVGSNRLAKVEWYGCPYSSRTVPRTSALNSW